jgi:hypothetical protein
MWVRPALHKQVASAGDDRQVLNLDGYRQVRVVRAQPHSAGPTRWLLEAVREGAAGPAAGEEPVPAARSLADVLAVVPTEALANACFDALAAGLQGGAALVDLSTRVGAGDKPTKASWG